MTILITVTETPSNVGDLKEMCNILRETNTTIFDTCSVYVQEGSNRYTIDSMTFDEANLRITLNFTIPSP